MSAQRIALRVALQGLLFSLRAAAVIARTDMREVTPKIREVAAKAELRVERARQLASAPPAGHKTEDAKMDAVREAIEDVAGAIALAQGLAEGSVAGGDAADRLLVAAAALETAASALEDT